MKVKEIGHFSNRAVLSDMTISMDIAKIWNYLFLLKMKSNFKYIIIEEIILIY